MTTHVTTHNPVRSDVSPAAIIKAREAGFGSSRARATMEA